MKKLLSILFAFAFISWNTSSVSPTVENNTFNPLYYQMHHMTPLFVLLAKPTESYNVGVSSNAQVWTSERIDATTIRCSGMRASVRREPDSAFQTDMYGKKVVLHFDNIVTEWYFRVWTDHIICSGSGSCSVSSQGANAHGDRLLVTAGTYTGGGFTNLNSLTVIPNTAGHTVFWTNGMGWRSLDSCELGFMTFMTAGDIDMRAFDTLNAGNKPIRESYLHNLSFINMPGACINANGGIHYIPGFDRTAEWRNVTIDSVFEFQSDLLCQGSFGSPTDNAGNPPAVMIRNTITRFVSIGTTATVGQGTEIRGIQFEYLYHEWTVFDISGRGNSGDDGLVYGHGTGIMFNIYKWGGPGYISRMAPTKEIGRPGISWEYNMFKGFSTDYGVIQHQNPDTVAGAFGAVDSINVWNITGINMATDNTYWCQDVVLGDMSCVGGVVWMYAHIKNCLAINVADAANGGAGHDMGTGTIRVVFNMGTGGSHTDTAHNQYFWTQTQAGIDSTTVQYTNTLGTFPYYRPLSTTLGNILHGGTTNPFTSVDYLGTAMRVPPDIGYLQLQSTTPPCSNCMPVYRWSKTIYH